MAIPKKDSELSPYATNFDTRVTATPATWQLLASDATALHAVVAPYVSAYTALVEARNAGIRSSSLATAKDTARTAMLSVLRALYARIQANGEVSDADKDLLGISVRKTPSPIPVPAGIPNLDVVSVVGYTVQLRAHGEDRARRSFPEGVRGLQLYSFVGENPPADPNLWRFEGAQTTTQIFVSFDDATPANAKVWFRACWTNPRNQCGNASDAVSTYLQHAPSRMAA